eukprot:CAMPEP_0184645618 /NCGR_PEP_ID=MMETSP0308-20130426/2129_1 /TAXON_ID=38269 /ORGANISM="Gloeochaete witrockiana, Strain SAG 46.84" /LENGTH=344 /DNA_ID=CAMNT_0027074809 /DNA_START=73 /DNA_END=1107 /DNA_ORIENTATION=-
MDKIAIVDISRFLDIGSDAETCKEVASSLRDHGVVVIRDRRWPEKDNEEYLDLLEGYFGLPDELKMKDVRASLAYQVGTTPGHTERARSHEAFIATLSLDNRPHPSPGADPKWRFFWRIGPRPAYTMYPELNAEQVIPAGFSTWEASMNHTGSKLLQAVVTVSEMAALGFGLPKNAFTSLLDQGPHLLAPTGSDLSRFGTIDQVLASFHYDLNFLTCHGRSRFPGLFIWTRKGKKVLVRVPEGCLLIQAGKQMEWLTGGEVLCGYHEVVVCQETLDAMAKPDLRSLWRISSTCFSHIASDQLLQPLGHFASNKSLNAYPPTPAGHQVEQELVAISLRSTSHTAA